MTEESIFAAALDKQTAAERAAFLDEACGSDAALRQRVAALVAAHEQAADFLEKPAVEQMAASGPSSKGPTEAVQAIVPPIEGITPTPPHALLGETQAEAPHDGTDSLSLNFLAPCENPDALGRLSHYQVLAVIGRGGMGVVLKAFDEELRRVVAIKVMTTQTAAAGTARKRFRREAQAAAAVRDDHVIDIHAVEEVNGLPYLVMEYVSGISLQERIDQSGPLELKEILRIGTQTAKGLAKAHAQGLIHRDIKPANILLENGVQRVKITDFGLARAVDDSSLTQSGVIAGTPQYMAPEQARGETVDHRADLFSLGSVLYAMCTGHPPFRASSTMAVLKRVCDDTPRPIREVNPDIPDWLAVIIAKLHAKESAQRFQSATEVADLLGQHLLHLQQPSVVPQPPTMPRSRNRPRAWSRPLLAAICVVVPSCCCLGALLYWKAIPLAGYLREPDRVEDPSSDVPRRRSAASVKPPVDSLVRARATLDGHTAEIWCVAWAPDGQALASASHDNTVRLWRREGDSWRQGQVLLHPSGLRSTAFSHDGRTLATGGYDKTVNLWRWKGKRWQNEFSLRGHKGGLSSVAFAPDGKLASGDSLWPEKIPGEVKIWDSQTGKELASLLEHREPVNMVRFSPDGKLLATVGEWAVKLWDTTSWQVVATLDVGEWLGFISLAFAPDGSSLAIGSNIRGILRWKRDGDRWQEYVRLAGHTGMVWGLAFHPSGKILASGGDDKTIRLWDVATGKELEIVRGHTDFVRSVAFSPNGKTLASGSHDKTVKLWDVSLRGLTD